MNLALVLIILLGIVSIIDYKFKQIPSFFLTGILFITTFISFYDTQFGMIRILHLSLAFIFAWMLYEADFIGGVADIKVISIIGLMILDSLMFLVFVLLVMLYGMAYKLTFRYLLKKEYKEEIPFIPCLFIVYLTLYLIGGLI